MRTWSSVVNRLLPCVAGAVMLAASGGAASAPSGLPQNAALVYYQALLFRSMFLHPPEDFYQVSSSFEPRFDPSSSVNSFVQSRDFQELIELITAGSKMLQCDWGLVRTARLNTVHPVGGPMCDLTHFLVVRAKVSACDGRYKAALENALTMRRVSRHLGDDTPGMLYYSESVNAHAFSVIQYVLGKMPPDVDTLTWLQQELASGREVEWHPRETLTKWLDWQVECLQASPEFLAKVVENPLGLIPAPTRKKELEGLTPIQVLERARLSWKELLKGTLEIIESEKSPQEKYLTLKKLEDKVDATINEGDPIALMPILRVAISTQYSGDANCRARVHAVHGAIAIYLIKATTGQLPETLPEGLPKDPYSGEDFEYRPSEKGFILRSRARPFGAADDTKIKQFEFQLASFSGSTSR